MHQGLGKKKARVFPVNQIMTDLIHKERSEPDKKGFFANTLKRRFSFNESSEAIWNKENKFDAPLSNQIWRFKTWDILTIPWIEEHT